MKKKIISFIGLALFVGAVALNVKVTNSDSQINELTLENVTLENIEAMASAGGGADYCWTDASLGGIVPVTPCTNYDPNVIPHYECGATIPFSNYDGTRLQCR